jgi:hypothetical protein
MVPRAGLQTLDRTSKLLALPFFSSPCFFLLSPFAPADTHTPSLEAARHCRWVDEIVADAPWIIDQAFLDKYQIDYVAHDEDPYAASGHDDVYEYCKGLGMCAFYFYSPPRCRCRCSPLARRAHRQIHPHAPHARRVDVRAA